MNTLTLTDDLVGAIGVAIVVAALLRIILVLRPLRNVLIMHYDYNIGRVNRVPLWRLPVAAGIMAGIVAAAMFAFLAAT